MKVYGAKGENKHNLKHEIVLLVAIPWALSEGLPFIVGPIVLGNVYFWDLLLNCKAHELKNRNLCIKMFFVLPLSWLPFAAAAANPGFFFMKYMVLVLGLGFRHQGLKYEVLSGLGG